MYELSGDGGNHSQEVQCMTYQKEEKMGEGLKLKTLSICLSPLLMPLSSLESLANVVSVPKKWLLYPVSIHLLHLQITRSVKVLIVVLWSSRGLCRGTYAGSGKVLIVQN